MSDDSADLIAAPNPFAMVSYELLKLSSNAVKLYVILSKYADNQTGRAWPGRTTLATQLGYKQARAVDAVIAELEAAGAITVTRTMKPGAKTREHNVYTVKRAHEMPTVEVTPTSAPQRTSAPEGVVRHSAQGSAPQRTRVVRHSAHELIPNELISEELISTAPADAEAGQMTLDGEPAITPDQQLSADARFIAVKLVERHPSLKFHAVMGTAKRTMKAYGADRATVGRTMESLYVGGRGLSDPVVGQAMEGYIDAHGRTNRPEVDRTAEKMHNTMTMPLTGPAPAGALTADPFTAALRITS